MPSHHHWSGEQKACTRLVRVELWVCGRRSTPLRVELAAAGAGAGGAGAAGASACGCWWCFCWLLVEGEGAADNASVIARCW